jgi:hypothetical protein
MCQNFEFIIHDTLPQISYGEFIFVSSNIKFYAFLQIQQTNTYFPEGFVEVAGFAACRPYRLI